MRHHERGAATAEYTVGTLGATFIGYWLIRLTIGGPDPGWFGEFVRNLLSSAFSEDTWDVWGLM